MYQNINILPDLRIEAAKFVMDNDRMMYAIFFTVAEQFCIDNNVMIGGRVGIDLLAGRELTNGSFMWDLYCDDTYATARKLAEHLSVITSPHIPADTTALQTNIRHKEFTISVNARILFKIYSMDTYRGMKLINILHTTMRPGYFLKKPLRCIPGEMQLISIYRTLYSPARLSMWQDELNNEERIYELLVDTQKQNAPKSPVGNLHQNSQSHATQRLILDKLIKMSNSHILIGDHAIYYGGFDKTITPNRLQIITDVPVEQLTREISRCISQKVTYVRYSLNIPDDFQIIKYTIYIDGKNQYPIMDIFNSSVFEMIPYNAVNAKENAKENAKPDTIRIGSPWVLMRFLLIDIWVLKLILGIGTENNESLTTKIAINIERCDLIRKNINSNNNIIKSFQPDGYVGVFVDEAVAKKQLIKEIGERFQTYYPAYSKN